MQGTLWTQLEVHSYILFLFSNMHKHIKLKQNLTSKITNQIFETRYKQITQRTPNALLMNSALRYMLSEETNTVLEALLPHSIPIT